MSVDNIPVLVNGVSKTHADITFVIDTQPIIGITRLNYADPQDITGNYSNANKMTSVGFGAVKPVASIGLNLEAAEQIQALAANLGGRIQNIPFFEITILFDSAEPGLLVSHTLRRCKFKGRNTDSQVDNTQVEETLELFVADIKYQTL